MTAKSFAAFRQLSVQCDFSEKNQQLKKQLSVDAGLKQWQRFDPVLKSTQKSVTLKTSVQKNDGIFSRNKKEETGTAKEEDVNKRNLKIFLAHDVEDITEQSDTSDPRADPDPIDNANSVKKPTLNRTMTTTRPVSAASKRQHFQKRLNSVFNATVKELPKQQRTLIRSTSAPCKTSDQRKSKFQSRHKLLSNNRSDHAKAKEPDPDGIKGKNKDSCRVSPVGFYDVETMVSLISPSGSDCEDTGKPEKANSVRESSDQRVGTALSLPKEEKSVSFQQSSIHSVRSFSASFPARRAVLGNNRMLRHKMRSSSQERNGSLERKRLNSTNIQGKMSMDETKTPSNDMVQGIETIKASPNPIEEIANTKEPNITRSNSGPEESNGTEAREIEDFESSKEKQCWNLYSKITKNGINVSFDTILRGILTPTEYRTRQMSLNMSPMSSDADNCI
ncbi:unnamed protein product [Phaedon cochleariae]|uniref:Uncharacterized protein n=1 Tax=Phaedon cochleariae TaxID=80249 RepID=A0A9N9SJ04_PHACE|nr:unnamed protein product [Phaedon cochleariae]